MSYPQPLHLQLREGIEHHQQRQVLEGIKTCPSKTAQWLLYKGFKIVKLSRASEAHTCNPSYSGGRDQEDCSSKPVQENSSRDPISKKPFTRKGWWNGSRKRP
jgi:hypothetical protein